MGLLGFLFGSVPSSRSKLTRRNVSTQTRQRIELDWKQMDAMLNGSSPSQLKQALIIADKSVDNALRDLVEGENMGQRLKNAKDLFEWSAYDKIWKAHKMRNSMVHEAGFDPTKGMIIDAVEDLRSALKILGIRV